MSYCTKTKDYLLNDLNACQDIHELMEFVENKLFPIFEYTSGLWLECGYGYKASEIANRARKELEEHLKEKMHPKTEKKANHFVLKLRGYEEIYYRMDLESKRNPSNFEELVQ